MKVRSTTRWVRLSIGILIVIGIISIISTLVEIFLLQDILDGNTVSESYRESINNRQVIINWLYVVVIVLFAITFLTWVHNIYKNLSSLTNKTTRFSSGWSIGWFFIPLFNLFRPYQVLSEIWRGSTPNTNNHISPRRTGVLSWWWMFFILAWFVFRIIGLVFYLETEDSSSYLTQQGYLSHIDDMLAQNYVIVASRCLDIISSLITLILVLSIEKHQKNQHV